MEGDHTSFVPASGSIQWEGQGERTRSLRLRGMIADHQVTATVAVVGDHIHLFTRVRAGDVRVGVAW